MNFPASLNQDIEFFKSDSDFVWTLTEETDSDQMYKWIHVWRNKPNKKRVTCVATYTFNRYTDEWTFKFDNTAKQSIEAVRQRVLSVY